MITFGFDPPWMPGSRIGPESPAGVAAGSGHSAVRVKGNRVVVFGGLYDKSFLHDLHVLDIGGYYHGMSPRLFSLAIGYCMRHVLLWASCLQMCRPVIRPFSPR